MSSDFSNIYVYSEHLSLFTTGGISAGHIVFCLISILGDFIDRLINLSPQCMEKYIFDINKSYIWER